MPRPRGLYFAHRYASSHKLAPHRAIKTCLFFFFLYPIFMSETKKEEKNGKQTDKDIDKLEKQAKGFKKGTIGLGVLTVGAAVGAILTFALGGPVVLGVILIIAEFGFGAGTTGCAGRYRGIKKSIDLVKKSEKGKERVEGELKSKKEELDKEKTEWEKKNMKLKENNKNLQEKINNLSKQLEGLGINSEQKNELNNNNNNGLIITNVNQPETQILNSGVNTVETYKEKLEAYM